MPTVNQLKLLIKIAGLNLHELSRVSGVSLRAMSYWLAESGERRNPSDEKLQMAWDSAVKMAIQKRDDAAAMTERLADVGIVLEGESCQAEKKQES